MLGSLNLRILDFLDFAYLSLASSKAKAKYNKHNNSILILNTILDKKR